MNSKQFYLKIFSVTFTVILFIINIYISYISSSYRTVMIIFGCYYLSLKTMELVVRNFL